MPNSTALARCKHKRHDVIVCQVVDRQEATFDFKDSAPFEGLEGETRVRIDPRSIRKDYLRAFNEHQEAVRKATQSVTIPLCVEKREGDSVTLTADLPEPCRVATFPVRFTLGKERMIAVVLPIRQTPSKTPEKENATPVPVRGVDPFRHSVSVADDGPSGQPVQELRFVVSFQEASTLSRHVPASRYLFWMGITLGSLGVLMVHHLSGGAWGMAGRRVWEAATKNLPLMAVLFVPIALNLQTLYSWARPEAAEDHLIHLKHAYLNAPFFLVRAVIFFVIALIAAVLGFSGVAGAATNIAWILFVVFVILAIVSLLRGKRV